MAVTSLAEESLNLLNNGLFQFDDPGPLHAPILGFSVRRDDKLALVLESEVAADAKSNAAQHPPGTVRLNTDRAKLVNAGGAEAELVGVQPYSFSTLHVAHGNVTQRESSQIRQLHVRLGDLGAAAYTIEWLENLPVSPFVWPDSITTTTATITTRRIGLAGNGITIDGSNERLGVANSAAKLTVAGATLYLCALGSDESTATGKPGCIVYAGTPDESFRKKVRTALSFALGVYLVDLGHTVYDSKWHIVSAFARGAYSLWKRAFDLPPQPLAPLGTRYLHELGRVELARMVEALVSAYEALDLGNLSWAYWHACAATVHIAPAHFGAAIEALQRSYLESNSNTISRSVLPRCEWHKLKTAITGAVANAGLSDQQASVITGKLHTLNQVEQRTLLKAVLQSNGIDLGTDEDSAWKRRNSAAHGLPIKEGEELAAIRDMKLLRGLFHRMLLRITGAASSYVDYTSISHPYRPVEEAPTCP